MDTNPDMGYPDDYDQYEEQREPEMPLPYCSRCGAGADIDDSECALCGGAVR